MKRIILILLPALMLSVIGCDKKDDNPNPNPNPNPNGPTPFMPAVTGSTHGAFIAIKMNYTMTNPQLPVPISLETEMGVASVYSAPGSSTFVDAGTVSLNDIDLDKQTNNSYMKLASIGQATSSMNLSSGANWAVGGAGSVAAFTYDHTASFPNYTDSLPSVVTKTNGITIDLSSTSNADSIYVMVAAGNQHVIKSFAGNATSATLSSSDLSALPAVSDNTAFLEVVPVRFTVANVGGKDYVFIKEKAVVRAVNIN